MKEMSKLGLILLVAAALLLPAAIAIAQEPEPDPVEPDPIVVTIDIKPGSDTNPINLGSRGVTPVAILGSETFDVMTIDRETLDLAGASPKKRGRRGKIGSTEDINSDGFTDLVVQFNTPDLQLTESDTEATLTGALTDATPITGSDVVTVKAKKSRGKAYGRYK